MKKPLFTAKIGSVWIPVYKYEFKFRDGIRTQYRFTYSEKGKSRHVTSSDLERIKVLARERAQLIAEGRVNSASPIQEAGILDQCRSLLGGSLEHLLPAVRHYVSTVLSVTKEISIRESVAEYLLEKKPTITPKRHSNLESIFNRIFSGDKGETYCTRLTPSDLDGCVRDFGGSDRTKYDVYSAISGWIRWMDRKGYITDGIRVLDRMTIKGRNTEGKREIFTPEELKKLMTSADKETQIIFALCAFGGLRKAESLRVRWDQIDLTDGFIRLEGDQVKTSARRAVEILPTLKAWLETVPVNERTGSVWKKSYEQYFYYQQKATSKAEVDWKDNGLRHMAISARCCNGVTMSEIADWAGNSVKEIKRHYLNLISKADAVQWWSVLPE